MDENLEGEGSRNHRGRIGADIAKRDFDVLPLDRGEQLKTPRTHRFIVGHNLFGGHRAAGFDVKIRCAFGGHSAGIGQLGRVYGQPKAARHVRHEVPHRPARAPAFLRPHRVRDLRAQRQDILAAYFNRRQCGAHRNPPFSPDTYRMFSTYTPYVCWTRAFELISRLVDAEWPGPRLKLWPGLSFWRCRGIEPAARERC